MTTRLSNSTLRRLANRRQTSTWLAVSLTLVTLGAALGAGTALWAQPQTEDTILEATQAGTNVGDALQGLFGTDVALSFDTEHLLIGAPGSEVTYRFRRQNEGWLSTGSATSPTMHTPVAISGSELMSGFSSGVVDMSGQIAEFVVTGLESPVEVLAMRPGVIAVGLPSHAAAGRVRVYRYNSEFGIWLSDSPMDGGVGDDFGTSLAFDSSGDFLIVGAPGAGVNGEVEVFAYVGATWVEWQTIEPPADYASQTAAAFGSSVAVAGNRLAVGAPDGNKISVGIGIPAIDGGIVELFEFSFLAYEYRQRFQSPIPNYHLGTSVSMELLDGETYILAAGAPAKGTTFHGRVRTYWSESGNPLWTEGQILQPSDGGNGDEFGAAVAVGGGVVAAGAPGRPLCGEGGGFCVTNAGAVYTYDLQGELFADGFEAGDVSAWQ